MSDFLDVTFLAILQGVAEFLPISSSGHLVIGQHVLGVKDAGLQLDVFLHVGTLLSVAMYYRKSLWRIVAEHDFSYLAKIVLSALPAVAVYAIFKEEVESLFNNTKMVGALLMFTGAVLAGTRFLPTGTKEVSFLRALWMGCMQAVALLPGVSRSGMTLAAARSGKVEPSKSAEFSFLMSSPLILGGTFTRSPECIFFCINIRMFCAKTHKNFPETVFVCAKSRLFEVFLNRIKNLHKNTKNT